MACGILALRPGVELVPPALPVRFSATGLPEKSLEYFCSQQPKLRQLPAPECKSREGRDLALSLLLRTVPGEFICAAPTRGVLELAAPSCQAPGHRPAPALFRSPYHRLSGQQRFSTSPSFSYEKGTNECFFMRRKITPVGGGCGIASLHTSSFWYQ